MAKTSYLGSNVETQDTFSGWLEQTNKIIYDMGSVVLTAASVNEPNTTNGAWTSGNTNLEGYFSANVVAVQDELRGGTVEQSALLTVTSNTTFTGANVIINSNTTINGTNTSITSNGVVFSSNSVIFNLGSTGNTTVNTGVFYVHSNTEIDGDVANIHVTTIDITGNTTVTGTDFILYTDTTRIGTDGTNSLDVYSTSDFNANVNIDGITTITANVVHSGELFDLRNDVIIGASEVDTVTINADVSSNIIPDGDSTRNIGNDSNYWANVYVDDVIVSANVNVDGKVSIKGNTAREVVAQSTTTAYQDLKLTLRTSAGSEKNPIVANSTVVYGGSSNNSYDLGAVGHVWSKAYLNDLDIANSAVIDNQITVTGAATFSNTASISGNTIISTSSESSNTTTGALVVSGGVGIGGKLNVSANTDLGGTLVVGSTITANGAANVSSMMVRDLTAGRITFAGTSGELSDKSNLTFATSNNTLTVTGNTIISSDLSVGDDVSITDALTVGGLVNFNDTTDAANATSASVIIDGGLGVAKDVWIGDGILLDESQGIYLENQKHAITFNDGGGNFNIRVGHKYNNSAEEVTEDGYVMHQTFSQSSGLFEHKVSSVAKNTGDTDSTFFTQLSANSSGVYASYQGVKKFETQSTGAKVTGIMNVTGNTDIGGTLFVDDIVAENNLRLATESTTLQIDADTTFTANSDVIFNADARFKGTVTLDSDITLSVNTSVINYLTVNEELRFGTNAVVADNFIPANTSIRVGTIDDPFGSVATELLELGVANSEVQSPGKIQYTRDGDNDAYIQWNESVDKWQIFNGNDTFSIVGKLVTAKGLTIGGVANTQQSNTVITIDHEVPPAGPASNSDISVNGSNGTVIQDLDLDFDEFGHVVNASVSTVNLDGRYYTETESDSRFVNVTGDTMSGDLDLNGNDLLNVSDIRVQNYIYHDDDTNTYAQFNALDSMRIVTGGTERFRANNSGVHVTSLGASGDITITNTSPKIHFKDSTTDAHDFWAYVNSNQFYILTDRGSDGSWETPHPLELRNANTDGLLYGNRILTIADEGSGNGLDADTVDGVHASSFLRSDTADIKSSGTLKFNDNVDLTFGSGNDVEFFNNGSDMYIDLNGDHDLILRDGNSNNNVRFRFYTSSGNFTNDGTIVAGGTLTSNTNQAVFADDYHPNADKWTTARTLSLSGDASGSVSWDGSANADITVTVANDSHTHDGRYYTETEADNRFVNTAGDTMSGLLTISHAGNEILRLNDTAADGSPFVGFSQNGTRRAYIQFLGGTSNILRLNNDVTAERLDIGSGTSGLKFYAGGTNYTVWHSGNDGGSSGLNADQVDGYHASDFIRVGVNTSVTSNTEWADNKQVQLGTGSDTRMYHNGTDTIIEQHTGNLYFKDGIGTHEAYWSRTYGTFKTTGDLRADKDIYVGQNGGGDSKIFFYDDNSDTWRQLFWDDSANAFRLELNDGTFARILTTTDEGGIDADTVDGISSGSFIRSDADDNVSAHTEWQDNKEVRFGNGADVKMHWNGSNWFHTQASGSTYLRTPTAYYIQDADASNATRFTFDVNNGDLTATRNITASGDLYVGKNGGGDSNIHFYDDNTNTWRTLRWDDSANALTIEDNGGSNRTIYHTGNLPTIGNATLTVQGTGALGGSGTITMNATSNKTISITHDDTSSQASVNNSGGTVIQDVTLDGYGHTTGLSSVNLDNRFAKLHDGDDGTWRRIHASNQSFLTADPGGIVSNRDKNYTFDFFSSKEVYSTDQVVVGTRLHDYYFSRSYGSLDQSEMNHWMKYKHMTYVHGSANNNGLGNGTYLSFNIFIQRNANEQSFPKTLKFELWTVGAGAGTAVTKDAATFSGNFLMGGNVGIS